MACIVYQTDKKTGIKYAYKSESYWDAEKQQPRSKRTYLGRVDPDTGEIITKRSRKKNPAGSAKSEDPASSAETVRASVLMEMEAQISALKKENTALRKEKQEILSSLAGILKEYPE